MNYKTIEETIFKKCQSITKNKGKKLFINKGVNSIQGKKIGDIYHIYGKVTDDGKEFNTHLKYNLSTDKVIGIKCTCSKYKLYLEEGHNYYCEHLAAVSFRFLNAMKVKESNKVSNKSENKHNEITTELFIDSKIYYKRLNDVNYFELELKVGNKTKYPVHNISEFLNGIFLNKEVEITDNFRYSPKTHKINDEDMKYLKFIRKINPSEYGIYKNKIRISQKLLPIILEHIPRKELTFKDMYLEYRTRIHKDNLNIAFNLKEAEGKFILTSEKNLPINLDNDKRVFIFNREIYLLSEEVHKVFIPIYNELKRNHCIYFPGNNENYIKLISALSSISNKININDDLKNYVRRFIKAKYFIYKELNNIYCDIKVIYGDKTLNLLKDDKSKLGWIRDIRWEDRLLMLFENHGFIKDKKRLVFTGNDEDLFNLLNSKNNDLSSFGEVVIPKALQELKVYGAEDIYGNIYEEDWAIKLSYGVKDISNEDFKQAFNAYKNNAKFYKTKNNNFIDFTDSSVKELFNMIDLLNLEKDLKNGISYIHKGKLSLVEEVLKNKDLSFIYNKTAIKSISDKISELNNDEVDLTKKLLRILRNYQFEGVKWLKSLYDLNFGGILADEMGLGKTLQTIAFLSTQKNKNSLIVVPTSLIYNWKDEFKKFAPRMKIGMAYGETEERRKIINDYKKYDIIITTYGILKNDLDYFNDKLFDFCIIDEAQNIKNSKSQNSLTVKSIKAKNKFALTGTPIENNLKELWSIFDFIMPGFLYSEDEFVSKFNRSDNESLKLLRALINPFILRRTKEDVAGDLPNKSEKIVLVDLEKDQKLIYDSYIKNIKDKIKDESNMQVFSYLTRLRQICLHPALVFDDYIGNSGKTSAAVSLIEKQLKNNGKVLVFSQFTSFLKIFGDELDKNNIKYYSLTGATQSKTRIKLVNDFNDSSDVKVFLISLKAGGTGLNLTSANLVIHFDPWWNPAVESQASDRAHRIGQKQEVEVIKLISKNTIEEKIISLQEDKKKLIESVMSCDDISNTVINKKVIDELINSYLDS